MHSCDYVCNVHLFQRHFWPKPSIRALRIRVRSGSIFEFSDKMRKEQKIALFYSTLGCHGINSQRLDIGLNSFSVAFQVWHISLFSARWLCYSLVSLFTSKHFLKSMGIGFLNWAHQMNINMILYSSSSWSNSISGPKSECQKEHRFHLYLLILWLIYSNFRLFSKTCDMFFVMGTLQLLYGLVLMAVFLFKAEMVIYLYS